MTDDSIFPDMPDALYFDGSHFGIHSIADFDKYGPRGFWDRHVDHNHTDFGSRSYDIGTACHEAVLRGESAMLARVVKQPTSYTDAKGNEKPWNGNATACKDWKRENKKKIILNDADYHTVYKCLESVHETQEVMEYFKYGDPEVGLRTNIDNLPVQCKCDWLATDKAGTPTAIVDLKTCITMDDFLRSFHKYGYWRQAAHYTRVAKQVLGKTLPFIFVAVEKTSPNRCEMFRIDDEYIAEADTLNRESYSNIAYYMEQFGNRKPWPRQHKPKGIQIINKPSWLGEN